MLWFFLNGLIQQEPQHNNEMDNKEYTFTNPSFMFKSFQFGLRFFFMMLDFQTYREVALAAMIIIRLMLTRNAKGEQKKNLFVAKSSTFQHLRSIHNTV